MIEQNEVVTEQNVEVAANQSTEDTTSAQLQQAIWGDAPVIDNQQPSEEKKQEAVIEEKKQEPQEDILEPAAWLKSKWGWDSEDAADTEIRELRELKTKTPQEIKFANTESEKFFNYVKEGKLDEAHQMWAENKRIEKLTSGDVTPQTAEEIIKLQMKLKYPNLKEEQVNFQYNEDYGMPSKPTQKSDELDEEYSERLAAWQTQADRINMKREIAATMAIPELQKIKAELVLPDIKSQNPNGQSQRQPTQEEIAAETKLKEDWAKAATSTAAHFKGLSTTAKYKEDGKEIEIPVSYGLSQDEIKTLTNKLSAFAESNFDPYTILKERWVDEKGNDKLDQVVEDLSWLMFGKNAAQKFANEAAHQRLENYLKEKKNIRVDGGGGKDFGQGEEQKTTSERLQEAFWGN